MIVGRSKRRLMHGSLRCCIALCALSTAFKSACSRFVEINPSEGLALGLSNLLEGDVLQLSEGQYSGAKNCELRIDTSNIIVRGSPGTVIDCNKSSRHLTIVGANVSLERIEFRNGFSTENGGCLHISHVEQTKMSSLKFFNCLSTNLGGGIFIESANAIYLENVEMEQCSGDQGGGILITSTSFVHIQNASFLHCSADWGAGIFLSSSLLTATACTFLSNEATTIGGGLLIQNAAQATLNGQLTSFHGNSALVGGGIGMMGGVLVIAGNSLFTRNSAALGGAVYAQGAVLAFNEIAEFYDNFAQSAGGALAAFSADGVVSVAFTGHAIFRSNIVDLGYGDGGGAVCVQGADGYPASLSFASEATMENNSAPCGGALYLLYFARLSMQRGGSLAFNSADKGGAACLDTSSSLSIAAADLRGNSATKRGGAVYLSASNATLGGVVSHNHAGSAGGAAALYGASRLILLGAMLVENSARSAADAACVPTDPCGGGGLFLTDQSTAWIGAGSALSLNHAEGKGGGLLLCQQASAVMRNVSVTGNAAEGDGGGAAVLNDAMLSVSVSRFDSNSAGGEGGAIYSTVPGVTLRSVVLSSNTARRGGGAFATYAAMRLEQGVGFINNTAQGQGGAVLASGCATQISVGVDASVEMTGNWAGEDGGGAALLDSAAFQIDFAACLPSCSAAVRGDGTCNQEW